MTDAVVIGSGPNGLVAANLLADRGWRVLVIEEAAEPGGAVRSGELVEPGFVNDLFSAFYPLTVASPVFHRLRLEEHGLRWRRSRVAVAHPAADGTCPVISADLDETAASLDGLTQGDGEAWRRLYRFWCRAAPHLTATFERPFPHLLPAARLATALRASGLRRLARLGLLGVRRLVEEEFRGPGGRLLAGNALHADLMPETPPSAMYGWMLSALAQQHGFPAPLGGAGELTSALVRRLESLGGQVRCGLLATEVLVRRRRAVGVRTAAGEELIADRAVLADVAAPQLYLELLRPEHVPDRVLGQLRHFEFDSGTVKVDWTLDEAIPWLAEGARRAATVHVGDDMDALTRHMSELTMGLLPGRPYLVVGQYASTDPSRAPAGKDSAWAYTHVPRRVAGDAGGELSGEWSQAETEAFADRMEGEIERLAPGFRACVRGRHVFTPPKMQAANRNLDGGAMHLGTLKLHQQLVFRPVPGLGRPETPIRRLYLCSATIHPGGGVHGACGAAAARAAASRLG